MPTSLRFSVRKPSLPLRLDPNVDDRPRNFALRNTLAILAVCTILAALLLTQFAVPTRAAEGRDFAGIYSPSNVMDSGDQVRLTFSARVFNYSDSDVTGATVTLKGPGAQAGSYASFYGITLYDRDSVRLSQDIIVPRREYERWHKGQAPLLIVQYRDLSGAARQRVVELSRGPVGEE